MPFWTIGRFARMAGVSVQTLHHYDHVGLLSPRVRTQGGYRHYCEADLAKLQQIIALKFFGCELKAIKGILDKKRPLLEHLEAQERLLEKQMDALTQARILLRQTRECEANGQPIAWETTRELIEVYHMTQTLNDPWVREIFTPEELKDYVAFQKELQEPPALAKKDAFMKAWRAFIEALNASLSLDPKSETGVALAKECMTLINGIYGPERAHLRTKKFETGFGEGKGLDEVGFTKESVAWLEKAMGVYWEARLRDLFKVSEDQRLESWDALLNEMYGKDTARREALIARLVSDDTLATHEKHWLKEALHI